MTQEEFTRTVYLGSEIDLSIRTLLWYATKSSPPVTVRYLDYGKFVQMFVSYEGPVIHTLSMMVDPERQGTFFVGYYLPEDFEGLWQRYQEIELPDPYRERMLKLDTYKGSGFHEVCEDILVNLIRGATHE